MIESYVDNKDYIDKNNKELYNKLNMDLLIYKSNIDKRLQYEINNFKSDINVKIDNYNKELENIKKWISLPWYKKIYYRIFKHKNLWNTNLN